MQLNAALEDLDGLLPIEVVVTNEGSHTPLKIMQPVLVVTAITTSLRRYQYSVNSLISSS